MPASQVSTKGDPSKSLDEMKLLFLRSYPEC